MNWLPTWEGFQLYVPIITHDSQRGAHYEIRVQRRPHYCDRGDWLISVSGKNDIDAADGFPRYFIGSEDEVKHQMEQWVARRAAYQKWLASSETTQL